MANKYEQLTPIPGKFYVSEGWRAGNTGEDAVRSPHEHNQYLAEMVLAGPYNTRNEAEHGTTITPTDMPTSGSVFRLVNALVAPSGQPPRFGTCWPTYRLQSSPAFLRAG